MLTPRDATGVAATRVRATAGVSRPSPCGGGGPASRGPRAAGVAAARVRATAALQPAGSGNAVFFERFARAARAAPRRAAGPTA